MIVLKWEVYFMKYVKPELKFEALVSSKTIAADVGLSSWLDQEGFDPDAQEHITTYEVNS